MMSSPFNPWVNLAVPAFHLFIILIVTLVLSRTLRGFADSLVKPATAQTRAAQAHEQQSRAVANTIFRVGNRSIWLLAALAALPEFGVFAWPAVVLAGCTLLAVGFGAKEAVSDAIAGCHIVLEDQFAVGETVRVGDVMGRVEQLTLRRTVVRDLQGAMVTLSNGEIRNVANLSRDYAQAHVDVIVAGEESMERAQAALETASAELRGDSSWVQALIDGPRVLGIQEYGPMGCTVRLQVRTAPLRQDEVCRELRRRVQLEFQRVGIAVPSYRGMDSVTAFHALDDIEKPESAS
jgi:moderate conductance mechanosensitive channel